MATNSRPKFASFNDFIADGSKAKAPKDEKALRKVKVRATRTGYYDLQLRKEGEVFTVTVNTASKDRDGMLPSWVEPVGKVAVPIAPIPETQETAHLRGDAPAGDAGDEGDADGSGADDSDVI